MAKKRGIGSPLLSSMILLSGGGDRNSFRVASHSCYMYRQWETWWKQQSMNTDRSCDWFELLLCSKWRQLRLYACDWCFRHCLTEIYIEWEQNCRESWRLLVIKESLWRREGGMFSPPYSRRGVRTFCFTFFHHQGGVYKRKGTTGLSRRRGQQERAHLSESDKSVYDPLIMKKFVWAKQIEE